MKRFITAIVAGLVLLSAVAWKLMPNPISGKKTQITWVSDDNPVRREQLGLFNKLNPDYNMQLDPANTGASKVIVQSIADVGPDVFDCYNPDDLAAFVRSGVAWDVTDKLKANGVDEAKDVWKACLPNLQYKGRIYGCATNSSVNGIWFNKDIFRKAGIPFPKGKWTWKQFLPIAQKLTIKSPDGRTKQFGFLLDWYNCWQQFIWQWGGSVYSKDGTKCVVDSPEAIAGIQFMQDLVYKYHITPSAAEEQAASQGGWGSGGISLFGAGRFAMALGGRWWLCSLRSYKDLHLGATECPCKVNRVFLGYSRATLINKNSPHREQAFKFLLYLSGKPYNDLLNHQADALAPVIRYSYTSQYLHDPEFPDEDFNAVWRDALRYARPAETSPFINGAVSGRIFNKQIDLMKSNQRSAAEAMKAAASQINAEIQKNIQRDPKLKAEYEKSIGRKA